LNPEVSLRGVDAVLRDPTLGFYLLAESEGRIVGQLQITFEWSNWRNAFFWWIQSVYVTPEVRRQGVFRMLYGHVSEMAKNREDVLGLRLYVHEENRAAIEVYLRLGMKHPGYRMLEIDFEEAE
jgi:GNAT superfamily N-acetyltransferase